MVSSPTHEKGGLLDHIYIKNIASQVDVTMYFPFYTDHAAVSIAVNDLWSFHWCNTHFLL